VLALTTELVERLARGEGVAVHCRAGIGRAAQLAACVLVRLGTRADDALAIIGRARDLDVPDTQEHRAWVAAFAARFPP
jgi:protein-tyrosine phosphatase